MDRDRRGRGWVEGEGDERMGIDREKVMDMALEGEGEGDGRGAGRTGDGARN